MNEQQPAGRRRRPTHQDPTPGQSSPVGHQAAGQPPPDREPRGIWAAYEPQGQQRRNPQPDRPAVHKHPVHEQVVHNPARPAMTPPAIGDHTRPMTDQTLPAHWIPQLATATAALENQPTTAEVYRAMALAWHTAAALAHHATPASALGWLRLTEALTEARTHLADVDPAAAQATLDPTAAANLDVRADDTGTVPSGVDGTPGRLGGLEDTLPLRQAVAALTAAAATALRQLAAATDNPKQALATATAALTLQHTQTWP